MREDGCMVGSTGVGGSLTGRGGDIIIVDDPLKAEEAQSDLALSRVLEWFRGTLLSRLNDKEQGQVIVLMQRLHQDDLSGQTRQGSSQDPFRATAQRGFFIVRRHQERQFGKAPR